MIKQHPSPSKLRSNTNSKSTMKTSAVNIHKSNNNMISVAFAEVCALLSAIIVNIIMPRP